MKTLNIARGAALLAAAGIWVGAGTIARATLTWTTSPIPTVNSHDTVGAADILQGDKGSGNITAVFPIAQELLNLGAKFDGDPVIDPARRYWTSSTDYNGALVLATAITGGTTYVPSGYEYVVGKYDGQNAGYILFCLGGQDADLPATSAGFWVNKQGQGYGLSGWYAFDPVPDPIPEPTTMIAGALLLLPFGASMLRVLRRR